jgi:hypothetical protein
MKLALWMYFAAVSLVCVAVSIAVLWAGRIIDQLYPGWCLPIPTKVVLDYWAALYAVPLPSLVFALWFPTCERLREAQLHFVGAYSLLVTVLVLCLPLLALALLFVPWRTVIAGW